MRRTSVIVAGSNRMTSFLLMAASSEPSGLRSSQNVPTLTDPNDRPVATS